MANREEQSGVYRPPWAAMIATLIAMAALFLRDGERGYIGLPILAAIILASRVIPLRLPNHRIVLWTIRIVLFTIIVLTNERQYGGVRMWYVKHEYTDLAGYLCAAELAIQCWRRRRGSPQGEMMLLSAVIFTSATNTFQRDFKHYWAPPIGYLTPLYILWLALAFREFRLRLDRTQRRGRGWFPPGLRWTALVMALCIGDLTSGALEVYGEWVSRQTIDWLMKHTTSESTGSSPAPRLNALNIEPSPVRVLRLEGLSGDAHLRGMSFDTYADRAWRPTLDERDFQAVSLAALLPSAQGKRVVITRLLDDYDLLFAPLDCAGIAPMEGATVRWDPQRGSVLRSPLPANVTPYVYEVVVVNALDHQGPLCDKDAKERSRCLEVPDEIRAKLGEMAKEIANQPDPRRKAMAVQNYLQTNHRYSLNMDLGTGDPIVEFIVGKKAGHCQYFASAAVMLLRCADVPARYVSGYYAHERAGADVVITRQRDAHAWTEYWDGAGWVTLDATPCQRSAGSGFRARELLAQELGTDFGYGLRRSTMDRRAQLDADEFGLWRDDPAGGADPVVATVSQATTEQAADPRICLPAGSGGAGAAV